MHTPACCIAIVAQHHANVIRAAVSSLNIHRHVAMSSFLAHPLNRQLTRCRETWRRGSSSTQRGSVERLQFMKHAYSLQASQRHASHATSNDCVAPILSNVACPSALTWQTPRAPSYNDQREGATSVYGRCFETHVMFASHPAGPGQSSSDDLP